MCKALSIWAIPIFHVSQTNQSEIFTRVAEKNKFVFSHWQTLFITPHHVWPLAMFDLLVPASTFITCDVKDRHDLIMRGWTKPYMHAWTSNRKSCHKRTQLSAELVGCEHQPPSNPRAPALHLVKLLQCAYNGSNASFTKLSIPHL